MIARRVSACAGATTEKDGHPTKASEVLGEVVWLMSQSALHKQFFITDLEWPACAARNTEEPMTPVLLQQFRMFYADDRPIGVLLWAFVSDEVEARLAQGITGCLPAPAGRCACRTAREESSRTW